MGGGALAAHTRLMRTRATSQARAAQKPTGGPRRRDDSGAPALVHVIAIVTAFPVLAVTVLAVAEQLWMGIAFFVLLTSMAAITGLMAVRFTDSDDR